ncbi:hypothetical protein IE81DRAFT_22117 [Ceraceosorus guamensis]|uniref:Uncharacterized protein n=1 Tax=Ceraceosorus guamensis TaxID=1522189 RepID=A0A316VVS8_9BASI|nr:hypothetical protein IE81DRAFT_22117 [Ceraceosorus guamensis]PWN39545.1 hypothetical protein IE81DRAFT_22117 [Ceraceosorus guamensis]
MREGQGPWIDSFGLEECMLLPESFDTITRELDLSISSDPAFAGLERGPIVSANDVVLATQTESGRGLHSGSSATQLPLLPLPQSAPPSAVLRHPDQAALPMLQSPQHCFVPPTDSALHLSPTIQYRHPLTHDTCAPPPLPHLQWIPSGDSSSTGWKQHKPPTPRTPHASASPEQHFVP